MNNYTINQEINTSGAIAIIIGAGLFLGFLGSSGPLLGDGLNSNNDIASLVRSPVKIEESSKTSGQYTNQFSGEFENLDLSFEDKLASFYAQLLAQQEPLGKKFEQVLYDNLWDLLVRT